MHATWYFDFISPFAYLQYAYLKKNDLLTDLQMRPVLFAGLLKHWENKGPVEIPAKRPMTYQHCQWLADRNNIPFKAPPYHPFNPLFALRLAIATDCRLDVVDSLFNAFWRDGLDPMSPETLQKIDKQNGLVNSETLTADADVKLTLRHNTEFAIKLGVFGVPTLIMDNRLFWGFDMTDMAVAFSRGELDLNEDEYARLATLPESGR